MASTNSQTTFSEFPISQSISASFGGPSGNFISGSSRVTIADSTQPTKTIVVCTYEVLEHIWDYFNLSNIYKERTVYVNGESKTKQPMSKKEIWQGNAAMWGMENLEDVPIQFISVFEASMLDGDCKGGVRRWKNDPEIVSQYLDTSTHRIHGSPVCRITMKEGKIDVNIFGHSRETLIEKRIWLSTGMPSELKSDWQVKHMIEKLPIGLFE